MTGWVCLVIFDSLLVPVHITPRGHLSNTRTPRQTNGRFISGWVRVRVSVRFRLVIFVAQLTLAQLLCLPSHFSP